jgi:protein-S-isoprenylcysteine O-methyltransferase Ste14
MTLFAIASIELVAMWVLWLYPFLRKRFTGPKRQSEVMAHSGNWGLALESAGICCAWIWLPNTGPYAIVRHPVYASLFLMMLATGLLFARWQMLLLGIVLYIAGTEIRIHAEEGLLRARFGEQFEEYRRSVPAYLPFLR